MSPSVKTGPVPTGWPEWGIDLSSNNVLAVGHWAWLAEHGCAFAILRAAYGAEPDARFGLHAAAARSHGIEVGAYLRLKPERLAPVRSQVRAAVDTARGLAVRWAVDIEPGPPIPGSDPPRAQWNWVRSDGVISTLRRALWLVGQETAVRPMIYTYRDFWTFWRLYSSPVLQTYPLWAARYDRDQTPDTLTEEFRFRPTLWQYGGGPVDGVTGSPRIDKNVRLP